MKLTLGTVNATHATLHIYGGDQLIRVEGADATEIASLIAKAVNRDKHFDALAAALWPFRSAEMGSLLVGMIDIREEKGEEAQKRLSKYVAMIDVILDAAEQAAVGDGIEE